MKSLNSYCNLRWRASWITSTSHWLSAYPQWPMLTLGMVSHEELKIVHFFMWWATLSIIIQIHKFIFYSLLLSIDLFWRMLHVFLGKQWHELRFVWWNTGEVMSLLSTPFLYFGSIWTSGCLPSDSQQSKCVYCSNMNRINSHDVNPPFFLTSHIMVVAMNEGPVSPPYWASP